MQPLQEIYSQNFEGLTSLGPLGMSREPSFANEKATPSPLYLWLHFSDSTGFRSMPIWSTLASTRSPSFRNFWSVKAATP